jgi:hypothetical protein
MTHRQRTLKALSLCVFKVGKREAIIAFTVNEDSELLIGRKHTFIKQLLKTTFKVSL